MRTFKIGEKVKVIRKGAQYSTSHRPVNGSDAAMNMLGGYPNQALKHSSLKTYKGDVVDVYMDHSDSLRDGDVGTVVAYAPSRAGSVVYVIEVGENGYAIGETGLDFVSNTLSKLQNLKTRIIDAAPNTDKGWERNPILKQALDYVSGLLEQMREEGLDKVGKADITQLNAINRILNDN